MKQLFRIIALLLLFLAVIFSFNYAVDPANVFYDKYEETVADILTSGHNATGVENMDDRRLLQLLAQRRTQPIHTLVLGSSRAMQITPRVTGQADTFVAGVTGSDLRDCISGYFLFKNAGLEPSTVVLSAEFWYLSRGNMDNRALTAEYEAFCQAQGLAPVKTSSARLNKLKNFFSFPYFQSSVEYVVKGKRKTLPTPTDEFYTKSAVKRPDGSYGYEEVLRSAPPSVADGRAADKRIADNLAAGFSDMDPSLCAQFDAFVGALVAEGKEVRLLLSPVHPDYYALMQEQPDRYALVFDTEAFYREIGEKHGVAVYGSFDPAPLGVTNADFYDEVHPREDALLRYYDQMIK